MICDNDMVLYISQTTRIEHQRLMQFDTIPRAVEYTGCISVKGLDSPNECPVYDTKQSHGNVPAMLKL